MLPIHGGTGIAAVYNSFHAYTKLFSFDRVVQVDSHHVYTDKLYFDNSSQTYRGSLIDDRKTMTTTANSIALDQRRCNYWIEGNGHRASWSGPSHGIDDHCSSCYNKRQRG